MSRYFGRFGWVLLAFAMWSPGCSRREVPGSHPKAPKPDIVFILVDALRADRLGCYGCKRALTPEMDRIAAEGVLVERTTSQAPWTQPSVATIFTSLYPAVHGVGMEYTTSTDEGARTQVLSDDWVTFAEALQQGGYETAAFIANPWMTSASGFGQGFGLYDDRDVATEMSGAQINDKIRQWLGHRKGGRPLFLYIHYMDVHGPYWAPEEVLEPLLAEVENLKRRKDLVGEQKELGYLAGTTKKYKNQARHKALEGTKEYWVARYEAGVRYADMHVGELREILQAAGVWEESLVIVTADHGEELLDHGRWNHGFNLYEEQLHVPLFLRWKPRLRQGSRVTDRVQLIDIMPTLLDLAGLPGPDGMQGASMVGLLAGERWNRAAYAEGAKMTKKRAIYLGESKLIDFEKWGGKLVYDLSKDPEERNPQPVNQAKNGRELAELMESVMAENAKMAAGRVVKTVEPSDELRNRLKALGYAK
jgi:arylsulfatase A-like enzyme